MGKTALVLAGGGSRGAYELGVWQALREMGIEIHMVTRTSIGAINGAMIAQGDYDVALRLWNSIETSQVIDVPIDETDPLGRKVWETYQSFVVNFIQDGGTGVNPLKKTLESFLDEQSVRSSSVDYGLVALEMDSKVPHELFISDIPQGKMVDYIMASASIYPAFKPHTIDDTRYVDGAYHDNLPVKMAIDKGATDIIAVDLDAFGVVKKEHFKRAERVKYIRSYWNLGPSLVFDRATIRRNIRLGYLDTLKTYDAYEGNAFTFLPGFCKEITAQLSCCLPLEEMLQKSGGGTFDQLFLKGVQKIIKKRGRQKTDHFTTALVCAELAGELFGMDSEIIYSHEVWEKRLRQRVLETPLPDGPDFASSKLFDALFESAQTLVSRQSYAKLAGIMVAELIQTQTLKRSPASLVISPETFLAGVYLAAMKQKC